MAGRGPLVDDEAAQPPIFRARARRRPQRGRLPRAHSGSRKRPVVRSRARALVPPTSMSPPYGELNAHSAFSFGDGASAPEELARSAAELGHEALALTDHDGVWGAMEFAQASRPLGVRPIVGAELTITPVAASPSATLPPGSGSDVAAGRTRSYRDFVPSSNE